MAVHALMGSDTIRSGLTLITGLTLIKGIPLMRHILNLIISLSLILTLVGCVKKPSDPQDPYEGYNRYAFAFNQDVDHLIYRPAATVYKTIVPPPLKQGIGNAFNNVETLTFIPNDILQGKFKWALVDFWRIIINTTVGIGGLFDVASRMGLPKHYEDFGLTLAYWSGGKKEPYLIVPFIGPYTTRSAFGGLFDYVTTPWPYIRPNAVTYWAYGLKYLNVRASLLSADKLFDNAFDPYAFLRSAYLQRRNRLVKENTKPYLDRAQRKAAKATQPPESDAGPVVSLNNPYTTPHIKTNKPLQPSTIATHTNKKHKQINKAKRAT